MSHKKPKKLKVFIIHFAASNAADLQSFIDDLATKRRVTVIQGTGSNFQTIEIRSTHQSVRRFQKNIPKHVYVSCELKKP